jgi:hypothetical protein
MIGIERVVRRLPAGSFRDFGRFYDAPLARRLYIVKNGKLVLP